MAEILMTTAALLLALYGCVELVRRIVLHILKPRPDIDGVLVLPISGHHDDLEYLIRSASAQSHWSAELVQSTLILDTGMDDETRILAEILCRQYENINISTNHDLKQILTP